MKVSKIYFDMDGVLADFERGVEELAGFSLADREYTEEFDDKMWAAVKKVANFYDKLELMPGAEDMFNAVYRKYGDKCEILTGIPKERRGITTSGEEKTAWMHRIFSEDIKVNIVYSKDKKYFCSGPDCVLIEDREDNIEDWRAFGGTGILHKSSEDTIEKLKSLGIL